MATTDVEKMQHSSSGKQPVTKKLTVRKRGADSGDTVRGKKQKRAQEGNATREPSMLSEIRALGGDEHNLKLVRTSYSGSDSGLFRHEQGPDEDLQSEVAALAGKLGFKSGYLHHDSQQPAQHANLRTDGVLDPGKGSARSPPKSEKPPKINVNLSSQAASSRSGHNSQAIVNLRLHARKLRDHKEESYSSARSGSTSRKFLATIMSSGTLSDKVSALTLAFQESPIHNVRAFESLLGLASKKNRTHATGALGALVDLLGLGPSLPQDRKLYYFHAQPELLFALAESPIATWDEGQALPANILEDNLVAWAFEDWLKTSYFKLIQLLEVWCSDQIEYCRIRGLDFVYTLLKEKPEQESNLLRLLVGKLGDGERRVSSRASYLLLQLQNYHPGMKAIIAQCVERELFLNPVSGVRANYCAINTLNQTILSNKDPKASEILIRIYFDMFLKLLKAGYLNTKDTKEDNDTASSRFPARRENENIRPRDHHETTESIDKLVSAILTGINRAVPFVSVTAADFQGHLDTLFKISHGANFNTSIQALLLIQQLNASMHVATDRFYRTLYESLLDPRLATSSKHDLYIILMVRAIKNDVDVRRVKAFVKRMLQVISLHQVPFSCGILYVVSQARLAFPELVTMLDVPEDFGSNDLTGGASSGLRYDGRKRDPGFSNAHQCCLWEIEPLLKHFHPSATFYVQSIMLDPKSVPKPNLESHTLIRFLDKFAFRTPKTSETYHGASIMQPLHEVKTRSCKRGAVRGDAINTPSFWNRRLEDVAADDVFFHRYFVHTPRQQKVDKAKSDTSENSDNDSILKALISTQGEVNDDIDMSDSEVDFPLDSDDGGSEAGVLFPQTERDTSEIIDFNEGDENEVDDDLVPGKVSEQEFHGRVKSSAQARSRRRDIRNLPTFAAIEDYAELLNEED